MLRIVYSCRAQNDCDHCKQYSFHWYLGWLAWVGGDSLDVVEADVDQEVVTVHEIEHEDNSILGPPHVGHHVAVERVHHH